MSSQLLRRLSKVLQEWPIDKSREGRDLGEYLHNNYIKQFKGLINSNQSVKANEEIECLEKINSNYYCYSYPRPQNYSFSGDLIVNNSWLLSNESMKKLNTDQSIWKKVKNLKK